MYRSPPPLPRRSTKTMLVRIIGDLTIVNWMILAASQTVNVWFFHTFVQSSIQLLFLAATSILNGITLLCLAGTWRSLPWWARLLGAAGVLAFAAHLGSLRAV
ncbi:MAG TPA: hypothetical protein VGE07_06165 [Herpetosiphonaceae bacterium]